MGYHTRVLTCWVFLLSSYGVAADDSDAEFDESVLPHDEAEAMIEEIRGAAADAEVLLKELSSDRLSGQLVLERANYDANEIAAWVNDQTSWVPYRGLLRGADGVLMDRRGNSLDRSILLATLLIDAGYDARLVQANLSAEAANRLLAKHGSLNEEERRGTNNKARTAEVNLVREQLRKQSAKLAELVAMTAQVDRRKHIAAATDHWWVQVNLESHWSDLDIMFPQGIPRETASVANIYQLDNLPGDLAHTLTFRVILERWEGDRIFEAVALEHEIAVSDIPDFSYMNVGFSPYDPEWSNLPVGSEDLTNLQIANSARYWRPFVELGDTFVAGEWFNDSGQFEIPVTFAPAKKLSLATTTLSELGGPLNDDRPISVLTALWLEYEVNQPGSASRTVRREAFNIRRTIGELTLANANSAELGESARRDRGLALMGQTKVLLMSSAPHTDLLDKAVLETWRDSKNFFIAMVYLAAGRDDDRVPLAIAQGEFYPIDLLAMAVAREHLSPEAANTFVSGMQILSNHLIYVGDGEAVESLMATDIVFNGIDVLPGASSSPARIRIEQGVSDTMIETIFSDVDHSLNTYRRFREDSADTAPWVLISDARAVDEHLSEWPVPDRQHVRTEIANGKLVVASRVPQELAGLPLVNWWEIDNTDGTTLGMGYRGWGANLPERTQFDINVDPRAAAAAREMGIDTGCKYADATMILSLDFIKNMMGRDKLFHKIQIGRGPSGPSPLPKKLSLMQLCDLKSLRKGRIK